MCQWQNHSTLGSNPVSALRVTGTRQGMQGTVYCSTTQHTTGPIRQPCATSRAPLFVGRNFTPHSPRAPVTFPKQDVTSLEAAHPPAQAHLSCHRKSILLILTSKTETLHYVTKLLPFLHHTSLNIKAPVPFSYFCPENPGSDASLA